MTQVVQLRHPDDRARFIEAFRSRVLLRGRGRGRTGAEVDAVTGKTTYVFATHNVTVSADLESGRISLEGPDWALPWEMFLDERATRQAKRPRALGRALLQRAG